VYVTFTKVEVQAAGGEEDEGDDGSGDDESDPFGMDDENETTDTGDDPFDGNVTTGNETADEDDSASGNVTTGNQTTGNETTGNETAETEDPFFEEPDDFGSDETGWTTVFESSTGETVNLLNYTSTDQAFLGQAEVDPGRYTQIRVTVSQAWGQDLAGERVDFMVPSGELKTAKSFVIEDNETVALVIEIDLDQSIHEAGDSGQVIFRPVIGQVIVEYGVDAAATSPADSPIESDPLPVAPPANETMPSNETGNGSAPPS
jgi:hypothetical protein